MKHKDIMKKLEEAGYEAVTIGGAVRDRLLGQNPKDYDVFTNASGKEILSLFPRGVILGGDERQKKILTVIIDGVEVSQYRSNGKRTELGNSLVTHLSTCDFTINSIAEGILGDTFDPNNGIEDIENKEFGFVGNPKDRIEEDPLRIFRAVRFMAKLGFSFRHKGALIEYADELNKLPKERIREEFLKIISIHRGIELLVSLGLMKYVFSEFDNLKELPGGHHHNETVDIHSLDAFRISRRITNDKRIWIAALLHDIGKFRTYEDAGDGKAHFYQHERVGAEYVENELRTLKFKEKDITFIKCLVKNHMWSWKDAKTNKSFIKHFNYFEESEVSLYDFLSVKYADNQANKANTRKPIMKFMLMNNGLIEKYYRLKYEKQPFKVKDLVVGGKEVMSHGIKSGPEVGKVLEEVYNKVLDGELNNERGPLLLYLKERVSK